MAEMQWIKPPWLDHKEEWPFVGDPFLAALRVRNSNSRTVYWEYHVLTWAESGLECDGEAWAAWGAEDIERIARIPEPT